MVVLLAVSCYCPASHVVVVFIALWVPLLLLLLRLLLRLSVVGASWSSSVVLMMNFRWLLHERSRWHPEVGWSTVTWRVNVLPHAHRPAAI